MEILYVGCFLSDIVFVVAVRSWPDDNNFPLSIVSHKNEGAANIQ